MNISGHVHGVNACNSACFSGTQVDVDIFKVNSSELWPYVKAAVANKNAGTTVS